MKQAFAITVTRGAVLAFLVSLTGCSMFGDAPRSDDKVSYRTGARKVAVLDVPPDLTALTRDGRYTPQSGRVSASELNQPARGGTTAPQAATSGPASVALNQAGDLRIERAGQQRWLVTNRSPEQLWPQIKAFWEDAGFQMNKEDAAAGVMETDWAENKAKIPDDFITATVGKLFSNIFATGERDRYRTRLERTANGTEIYVIQSGIEEVFIGKDRESGTTWASRPNEPQLEAEMLSRLMLALSGTPTGNVQANATNVAASSISPVNAAAAPPSAVKTKARILTGEAAATLQLDDVQERAWRRVGLALDRSGFTVEERDRAAGTYAVRYVDAKLAAKDGPNFFMRMFGAKDQSAAALGRYRISVKAENLSVSRVSVQTPGGEPDNSANAQRIVTLLVEELKY